MLPVKSHPGYWVSNSGRVLSEKTNKFLKPAVYCKAGLLSVALLRDGVQKSFSVHRLVLDAFVGPRPEGMECRHLNGNPKDNSLGNLKWGTPKENSEDAIAHGTWAHGERSGSAKLTEAKVMSARALYATGLYSMRKLARMFGISHC